MPPSAAPQPPEFPAQLAMELTADDYRAVRRLRRRFPWTQVLTASLFLPSLLALYLGGFAISVIIVAVALTLLLTGAFRAAAATQRRKFLQSSCGPQTVTATPEFLEIDGVVEWRRIDWAYVESVEENDAWVLVELFEGEPLLIPPRAFSDQQRRQWVEQARRAMGAAEPIAAAELEAPRTLEDEPQDEVRYLIDNSYMQQIVDLRFSDRGNGLWLAIVAAATGAGCAGWPAHARQIGAVGAAILLPMLLTRVFHWQLERTARRRARIDFTIDVSLRLHEDGYLRSCRLFQSFNSWLLVRQVRTVSAYVAISHIDDEHMLVPRAAFRGDAEQQFCDAANRLIEARHAEDAEEDPATDKEAHGTA